jgi:hypothetical protein
VRWDTTAPFADRRPSPEDDVSDTVVLGAAAGPGSPFAHPSDPAHLSDDAASRRPAEPAAQDPRTAEPGAGSGRHGSPGGQPGRRASSDTDGLGLADLLAGALAAYRNL